MFVKEKQNRPAGATRGFSSGASSASNLRQRRTRPRQRVPFAEIEFADGVRGAVLDLSEGGLAVQGAAALAKGSFSRLRFRLPDSERWIEAGGKLAWMSPSKKVAGVKFVTLSEEARIRIRDWMEAASALSADENTAVVQPFFVMRPVTIDAAPAESSGIESAGSSWNTRQKSGNARKPLKSLVALAAIALLTTGASFTIGRERLILWLNQVQVEAQELTKLPPPPAPREIPPSAPAIGYSVPTAEPTQQAVQQLVEQPVSQPVLQPDPQPIRQLTKQAPQSAAPPAQQAAVPGAGSDFILQVASMKNKQYAESLADALREKNFPVLVSPAGALYVVAVGPFHDADSAGSAKKLLADENLSAVVHRVPLQ